jgi:hypothetical protein
MVYKILSVTEDVHVNPGEAISEIDIALTNPVPRDAEARPSYKINKAQIKNLEEKVPQVCSWQYQDWGTW